MRDTIFYASKDEKITPQEIAHADLARKLAGECMVLLENDGVLALESRGRSHYTETVSEKPFRGEPDPEA